MPRGSWGMAGRSSTPQGPLINSVAPYPRTLRAERARCRLLGMPLEHINRKDPSKSVAEQLALECLLILRRAPPTPHPRSSWVQSNIYSRKLWKRRCSPRKAATAKPELVHHEHPSTISEDWIFIQIKFRACNSPQFTLIIVIFITFYSYFLNFDNFKSILS